MENKFDIEQAIIAFNHMYGLPVSPVPMLINSKRLRDFREILMKEVSEIDEIIDQMTLLEDMYKLHGQHAMEGEQINWANQGEMEFKVMTGLADLLGDIQVYCLSEMAKWGLPPMQVLEIIMASNMSKLGADGLPIVDEQGKVCKGPNYWKPEPKIQELLVQMTEQFRLQRMRDQLAAQTKVPEQQG